MAQWIAASNKDKNSALKVFEDENDMPAVAAEHRNPMNYFKKHLINVDLKELLKVDEVFHSEILDNKFKILLLSFCEPSLQQL